MKNQSEFISNEDYVSYLKEEGYTFARLTPEIEEMYVNHNISNHSDGTRYEIKDIGINEDRHLFEFIVLKGGKLVKGK
ncbi:MAG: hypothetical protein NXI00_16130 [Cytophagales bacterium]|nr:hypothetical protein [Cytophagales bacterium]